uniref:Uncharacterized protein n=1 Tax=Meloidogyne javanica TaxID=6303 RepID=A0A915LXJ6_MELJA
MLGLFSSGLSLLGHEIPLPIAMLTRLLLKKPQECQEVLEPQQQQQPFVGYEGLFELAISQVIDCGYGHVLSTQAPSQKRQRMQEAPSNPTESFEANDIDAIMRTKDEAESTENNENSVLDLVEETYEELINGTAGVDNVKNGNAEGLGSTLSSSKSRPDAREKSNRKADEMNSTEGMNILVK